jgi:DNA-directed RNA polymerase subunit RPC12/RpoP
MSRTYNRPITISQSFICTNCGTAVQALSSGGAQRNHCPECLHSLHLDIRPGDRRSNCKGLMEPISVWVQGRKEWSIIHRCKNCGTIKTNRIAADDNEYLLFTLAAAAISQMPFPSGKMLDGLQRLIVEHPVKDFT